MGVPDGQPPSSALHEQQLRPARRGHRGLRRRAGPATARRRPGSSAASRRPRPRWSSRLGERRGLQHLQPHPAQRRAGGGRRGAARCGPATPVKFAPVHSTTRSPRCHAPRWSRTPCAATSTASRPGSHCVPGAAARDARSAGSASRGSAIASARHYSPPRNSPRSAGLTSRTPRGVEQLELALLGVGQLGRLAASRELGLAGRRGSATRRGGTRCPGRRPRSISHSSRARSARASSAPARRPLTQIRPKFRTLAPRRLGFPLQVSHRQPVSPGQTACIVPRIPPPTMTTRAESPITPTSIAML